MEAISNIRNLINSHYQGYDPSQIVLEVLVTFLALMVARILLFADGRKRISTLLFKGLKIVPGVQGQIDKEKDKIKKMIMEKFSIKDQPKYLTLPKNGIPREEVLRLMKDMKTKEDPFWKSGKISGGVYMADDAHVEMMNEAYSYYSMSNPLHPDIWPSLRKYEIEIIRMTANMMNGNEAVCGAVTSGGTESILMAIKAHRDKFDFKEPEIVIPLTAHAAFDKAAQYFGIKIRHAPLDPKTMAVDVNALEKLINSNTIMIAGSAPNYPYGSVDDIEKLAAIAKKRGIGMHVDCCLGGFLLPWVKRLGYKIPNFDFSISGITSMSVDTHKYGYTTKGTSVVLFKDEELRRFMYFVQPNWPGGVYSSATISGSRPGGLIACAYSSLLSIGESGFLEKSKLIFETAMKIKEEITKIPHLRLLGESSSSVVAFAANKFDIYKLGDAMSKRGWNLNMIQNPNGLHVCVTFPMTKLGDVFIRDLKESADIVETNPNSFPDGMAPVYGLAASFPDRGVVADIGKAFLDGVLSN